MTFFLDELRGHGSITAVGGQGHESSGGGAGGRIALHTSVYNEYFGELRAIGQSGTTSGDMGGPGSVLVEDCVQDYYCQTRLYLDGNMLQKPKPLIITEKNPRLAEKQSQPIPNGADISIDELMLNNMVGLLLVLTSIC